MGRRRTPRMPGLNVTHHTLAKIQRIGLRHRKSPPIRKVNHHSHPRRNSRRSRYLTVRCSSRTKEKRRMAALVVIVRSFPAPAARAEAPARSHFSGQISRHFETGADFDDEWGSPAHDSLLIPSGRALAVDSLHLALSASPVMPSLAPGLEAWFKSRPRNKVSPRPRNYSRNRARKRAIVAAEIISRRVKCGFLLPMWRCRPFSAIPAGPSSGAILSRRRPMTRSSSARAGTGSRPPITSPGSTASPMSRSWRRAGLAGATPGATPRSSAPITSGRNRPRSTSTR